MSENNWKLLLGNILMDPDFDDLRVIVIFSERRDEGFTPERFYI